MKISKIDDNNILIESKNGLKNTLASVFFAEGNGSTVFLVYKTGKGSAYSSSIQELQVKSDPAGDFKTFDSVSDAVQELNSFVGLGFKQGRVNPPTQELYIPSDDFDEVDLPNELTTGTIYAYAANNGLLYIASSIASVGLYVFDKLLKTFTKIYSSGQNLRMFQELSDGSILTSSSSGETTGIIRIVGKTATRIYTIGYNWGFFITSTGIVYGSTSQLVDSGIIRVNGNSVSKIYATGRAWSNFYELTPTIIYCAGGGANSTEVGGVVLLNSSTATRIYTGGYSWNNFFMTSKNDLYLANSSNTGNNQGLLHLSGNVVTQVYDVGNCWTNFFETSSKEVYCSSVMSTGVGLLYLNGSIAVLIIEVGYNWMLFETSKNVVYCGSKVVSQAGLYNILGSEATLIYTVSSGWRFFFESSQQHVYCGGGNSTSAGLLYLEGTTVTQIYTSSYGYSRFVEISTRIVYCSNEINTASAGILMLAGATATRIYATGQQWVLYKSTSSDDVYAYSTNTSYKGILYIKDTMVTSIYSKGYSWNNFVEVGNGYVCCSANTETAGAGLLLIKNGTVRVLCQSGCLWTKLVDKLLISTVSTRQLPAFDTNFDDKSALNSYQSGAMIAGYTFNMDGIVSSGDFPKKIFIPKHSISSINVIKNLRGDIYQFTTSSIITNKLAA